MTLARRRLPSQRLADVIEGRGGDLAGHPVQGILPRVMPCLLLG